MAAEAIASPWFDEVEHLSSMVGLLRGGVGIGVLPHLALQSDAAVDLLSRPLHSPDIVRRVGLFRRRDALLSQPAATLWDMLREHMAGHA